MTFDMREGFRGARIRKRAEFFDWRKERCVGQMSPVHWLRKGEDLHCLSAEKGPEG